MEPDTYCGGGYTHAKVNAMTQSITWLHKPASWTPRALDPLYSGNTAAAVATADGTVDHDVVYEQRLHWHGVDSEWHADIACAGCMLRGYDERRLCGSTWCDMSTSPPTYRGTWFDGTDCTAQRLWALVTCRVRVSTQTRPPFTCGHPPPSPAGCRYPFQTARTAGCSLQRIIRACTMSSGTASCGTGAAITRSRLPPPSV